MAKISFSGLDDLEKELLRQSQEIIEEEVIPLSEIKLTKDGDALICALYKELLQRRKAGKPKREARFFIDSKWIHANLAVKWSFEDVDDTCRELSIAGLIDCLYADDVASYVSISDRGIAYMENRFSDGVDTFFSYIERIRSILPW